jgi:hypothetical protein
VTTGQKPSIKLSKAERREEQKRMRKEMKHENVKREEK